MNQSEKDDRFILYHVGHFGFLINCLLHKLVYHPDDKAIFILDKVIAAKESTDDFQKVQNNFSYIGVFFFYNDREILMNSSFEKNPEKVITDYFDKFLRQSGINLSDMEEIYSAFDTYCAFGVYLSVKGIRYNMIECTPCQCRNRKRYFLNPKIPKYDEIIEKYSCLSADSKFCKKLISYDDTNYQAVETVYNNAPAKLIRRLQDDEIDKLVVAYDLNIETENDSLLYILQSSWFSGALGLPYPDGYLYINKKILDLFVTDENRKIIIKPHPNCDFPMEKWKQEFPGFIVIPGYFPSLLIPNIKGLNISKVFTTGSTGSNDLSIPTVEIPCGQFFPSYFLMNKLYVAICLSQYLKISKENFFHYGLHNKLTWMLTEKIYGCEFKSTWSNFEFNDDSLTIIDNIFWNKGNYFSRLKEKMQLIRNNAVIVFLNSKNDFIFMSDDLNFLNDTYELRLKKRKLAQDCFENMNDEVLYIFCKDANRIRELEKFLLVREFSCQGYELSVQGIESDKRINDLSIKTDYLLSIRGSNNTEDEK